MWKLGFPHLLHPDWCLFWNNAIVYMIFHIGCYLVCWALWQWVTITLTSTKRWFLKSGLTNCKTHELFFTQEYRAMPLLLVQMRMSPRAVLCTKTPLPMCAGLDMNTWMVNTTSLVMLLETMSLDSGLVLPSTAKVSFFQDLSVYWLHFWDFVAQICIGWL